MPAAGEREQQVHGERPVAAQLASRGDLAPQVVGGEDADGPEAAGGGDGPGELGAGQAAAHAGLDDGGLEAEPVEERGHDRSMELIGPGVASDPKSDQRRFKYVLRL